jgi:hypothetical protein
VYNDPYGVPYAFFSAYKRENGYNRYRDAMNNPSTDCPSLGVWPYLKTGSPLTFWNERSFQIISAGPNKTFGPGNPYDPVKGYQPPLWGPSSPAVGPGEDDMTNFAQKVLSAGQ